MSAGIDGQQVTHKRTVLCAQDEGGLYASGATPPLLDDVTVEYASSHSGRHSYKYL